MRSIHLQKFGGSISARPLGLTYSSTQLFSTDNTSAETSDHRGIRKLKDKREIVQEQRARNAELEEKAKKLGLGWRTVGAT